MSEDITTYNYKLEIPRQDMDLVIDWIEENFSDEEFGVLGQTRNPYEGPIEWDKRKWVMGFETKEAMLACKLMFG